MFARSLPAVFREMPVVLAKLRTDLEAMKWGYKDVERALRLKEWQETLVLLTILSKKYKVGACTRARTCAGMAMQRRKGTHVLGIWVCGRTVASTATSAPAKAQGALGR